MSMKVLHVLNTGKYSGAENVVITLIHALEGEVECAYTSPNGPIREILKEENIKYYSVSTPTINTKDLKKIINDFKPDIVHTHDFNAGVRTCFTKTNVPVINHLHNNTPWLRIFCLKSIAYFVSCLYYKKILTVSNSVMDEFIFGNIVKKKSLVVGNPIDLFKIKENANQKNNMQEPSDIIFLGRLSLQKNPMFFLDIMTELVEKMNDLRIAMVGSGELRNEVEDKIRELKLEKNIKLYGFQKNPYPLLAQAKVMCMPSKWEGFGLAAVEALTLGIPVVAADVGGLSTIVRDSCGKLCEKKEEYVSEILKLLNEPDYYKQKVNGALERATELENLQTYSDRIYAEYCNVLKNE